MIKKHQLYCSCFRFHSVYIICIFLIVCIIMKQVKIKVAPMAHFTLHKPDFVLLLWGDTTCDHILSKNWKQSQSQKKGAIFIRKQPNCSPSGKISTLLFLTAHFQLHPPPHCSFRISVWRCWYFWSVLMNQRQVQRYVYMCLFWWEYLYRYISEYFLRGVKSCDCFHDTWISSED